MSIDVRDLVESIKQAATAEIGKDVTLLRGYTENQLQAIAQQSIYVAEGIADGSITVNTRDYFLDSIEEMVRTFLNVLVGLVAVVIEKVWNAIVRSIWDAINKATGLALTIP